MQVDKNCLKKLEHQNICNSNNKQHTVVYKGPCLVQNAFIANKDCVKKLEYQYILLRNIMLSKCMIVRHSFHLKVKVHKVVLDIYSMQKLHVMSLVMQTCQNDLGLNLYVVPLTSCMVAISENGLVRSCKERSKARCY